MNNKELDQLIDESFSAEPDFHLSADFAQKVSTALIRHSQTKTEFINYLYIIAFLTGLLLFSCGIYYMINKELLMQFITFVKQHTLNVLFTIILLNFVFFADRVLLRLLFNKWRINY
jgi:hypothetical protein